MSNVFRPWSMFALNEGTEMASMFEEWCRMVFLSEGRQKELEEMVRSVISHHDNQYIDNMLEALTTRIVECAGCKWNGTAADLVSRDLHLPELPIDKRYCPQCKSVRVVDVFKQENI